MSRPYRPVRELEAHLARGELDYALAILRGIARERAQPLDLGLTAGFLPLIAAQRPDDFDRWALRWLERWCSERSDRASIDDTHELTGALAEIPVDPERGLRSVRGLLAPRARR